MPNDNDKIDINKHEVDIETLKKQNVNDLLSIKELYRKIEKIGEKITQIKYIDSKLTEKLKSEYENLKRVILDENIQAKLTNNINEINTSINKINNDINEVSSQLDTTAISLNSKINEIATTGTTMEVVQEKVESMAQQGLIQAYTLGDGTVPINKLSNVVAEKSINVLNPNTVTMNKILYNFTGVLNTTNEPNGAYTDFIEVEKDEVFTVDKTFGTNSTIVMFFTSKDDSSYQSRVQAKNFGKHTFTSPIKGYMKCNVVIQNRDISTVMICRGDNYSSTFIPYGNAKFVFTNISYLSKSIPKEALADNSIDNGKLDISIQNKLNNETRKLFITSTYVKKNTNLRIPYSSIILADDLLSVKVKSTYKDGYYKCHYKDYINYQSNNAGETIYLYDAKTDLKIGEKSFRINAIDPTTKTNPTTVKNILVFGDSFVQSGYISKGIKDELDKYGFTNFNFIGEKESFGVKHQGQGGYRIHDFLLNPTNMRPNFNHNPFWNTSSNKVDLSYYMTNLGVEGYLDYCVMHLGVNDIQNDATKEQIVTDIKTFIGYIHESYPKCKVIVNCLVPCYYDNRQYNHYNYNKRIFEYNDLLFSELQSIENVIFAPIVTTFNTEYAYPFEMKTPYKGSTEKEKILTDYIHPNECGYYMIADIDALCLINLL